MEANIIYPSIVFHMDNSYFGKCYDKLCARHSAGSSSNHCGMGRMEDN